MHKSSTWTRTVVLPLVFIAGCSNDVVAPPAHLTFSTEGRLERGLDIKLHFGRAGQDVTLAPSSIVIEPAAAAEVLQGGMIRLREAGTLHLNIHDGATDTTFVLNVAEPPSIVFHMLAGGIRSIYRIALDGRDETRITRTDFDSHDPTAAAGKVVFVTARDGNAELYSVPLTGGAETRITNTSGAESAPALSAQGNNLAYVRIVSGSPRLWLASSTGADAHEAAPGIGSANAIAADPSWHPAGSRVAYTSTESGNADIFDLGLSTPITNAKIVADPDADVEPSWCADGIHMAFASARGDADGAAHVYLLDTQSGATTRITAAAGAQAQPACLPDGRIVFVQLTGNDATLQWIDPAAPSVIHTVVTTGKPGAPSAANHP